MCCYCGCLLVWFVCAVLMCCFIVLLVWIGYGYFALTSWYFWLFMCLFIYYFDYRLFKWWVTVPSAIVWCFVLFCVLLCVCVCLFCLLLWCYLLDCWLLGLVYVAFWYDVLVVMVLACKILVFRICCLISWDCLGFVGWCCAAVTVSLLTAYLCDCFVFAVGCVTGGYLVDCASWVCLVLCFHCLFVFVIDCVWFSGWLMCGLRYAIGWLV